MLLSVAYIILSGIVIEKLMSKLRLPALIGYLVTGIILGPFILDMIDDSLLTFSPDIRQLALIIILTRAGLSLDIQALAKVGRTALMMCFVPASVEILASLILGPWILGLSWIQSLIVGSILAAVSPAVVVPRMVELIKEGRGTDKQIPQIILAGSSADDVYVLVLFTAFVTMAQGENVSSLTLLQIPISMIGGIVMGYLVGKVLNKVFEKITFRQAFKIALILSVSFILMHIETLSQGYISGMLAIISMSLTIRKENLNEAEWLSHQFNHLWSIAEIFLFFLVGVGINPAYILNEGIKPIIFIVILSLCRMFIGVNLCLMGTNYTKGERLFTMISYLPKATVQAAIGSIPMTLGLPGGELMFTISALSILITAPIGAIAIDQTATKLLKKSKTF